MTCKDCINGSTPLKCIYCGGTEFRARRGLGSICVLCGTETTDVAALTQIQKTCGKTHVHYQNDGSASK